MSILSLYYQVSSKKRDKWMVAGFAVLISCFSVSTLLVSLMAMFERMGIDCEQAKIFQCRPISTVWSSNFPEGCLDIKLLDQINAIFNMISDVIIIVLPIPVAMSLKVNRKGRCKSSISTSVLLCADDNCSCFDVYFCHRVCCGPCGHCTLCSHP